MTLFETTLTIIMTGLMTHIGDGQTAGKDLKSHMVVVRDRDAIQHKRPAFLIIAKADVEEASFAPVGGFYIHFFENYDEISFSGGIKAGAADASQKFQDFTPSLKEPFAKGVIPSDVRSKKPKNKHPNVVAKMFYPEGLLTISAFHTLKGTFDPSDEPPFDRCVPRATSFVAPTTDFVTMTIAHEDGTSSTLKLKPSSRIVMYNQTHGNDDAAGAVHYSNYMGVLRRKYFLFPVELTLPKSDGPCLETPTLPANTTVGALFGLDPTPAGRTDASAEFVPFIRYFISDHPACTNTDYP